MFWCVHKNIGSKFGGKNCDVTKCTLLCKKGRTVDCDPPSGQQLSCALPQFLLHVVLVQFFN